MPELPEVETVRRQLQPLVGGRRILGFRVMPGAERLLRGRPAAEIDALLTGRAFATVNRRGKYLGLHLDDGQVVVVHLRMTGSLRFRQRGFEDEPFTRAVFDLDHGDQLRFVDVRKFGTIDLVERMEEALPKLGPEPLSDEFTLDAIWHAFRGRHQPIKAALLDQRNIAGIGNIYADEALFLSRLNPEAPAGSLRPSERRTLHAAIQRTLQDGVAHGGASFRDYTDVDGAEGEQQYFVRVFRRTGEPCDDCGATIRRIVVGGRATHFCPKCQPVRQRTRKVTSNRPKR
ncbi:MAG: bifunctional DNA-formamidopyrimidine glycosylase/DNA-(apurinic or apyrimidinic site) lyase [Chloroflexota bacterium]|nr:bifunctional DNA-formamidopyrimidine glycosylase/DNA-(apurinic or apyrimidinic site) lyase [Chloroflexota bacterium]MDE2894922.1 bifunctional DNA-formamidopyrimidine glycosylase/DNA-(apurinic or apyrimidinic site) lyase [Chloroflexota bacterium]